MDLLMRMPYKMSKTAKFFRLFANNVLRDYHEIITMSKKFKFAQRTINNFNDQATKLDFEECQIFIDGENNFKLGIPCFSLCFLDEDMMMVYDVFTSTFYWGVSDEFFVNDFKVKVEGGFDRSIETDIIPMSLQITWFLTGAVTKIKCHDERFEKFLEKTKKDQEFYIK